MTHWDHLASHVPGLSQADLLDLGSGKGKFLIEAAGKGARVVGLEYKKEYIALANERANEAGVTISVVEGRGEALPFPDASFDFVNVNEVFEHVEDPQAMLREVHRVLRPTGSAYVSVPNRFGLKDQHYHLYFVNWLPRSLADSYIKLWGKEKDYGDHSAGRQRLADMHYATYEGARKIAEGAGFTVADIRLKRLSTMPLSSVLFPFYLLARTLYFDSFHLLLRPKEGGIIAAP